MELLGGFDRDPTVKALVCQIASPGVPNDCVSPLLRMYVFIVYDEDSLAEVLVHTPTPAGGVHTRWVERSLSSLPLDTFVQLFLPSTKE